MPGARYKPDEPQQQAPPDRFPENFGVEKPHVSPLASIVGLIVRKNGQRGARLKAFQVTSFSDSSTGRPYIQAPAETEALATFCRS